MAVSLYGSACFPRGLRCFLGRFLFLCASCLPCVRSVVDGGTHHQEAVGVKTRYSFVMRPARMCDWLVVSNEFDFATAPTATVLIVSRA